MNLEGLIKNRIRAHGALTVAEYMEIALTHPEHGYYMQRDPFGSNGDFITAPEISQVFGEIIGAWLAAQWRKLNQEPCALVELGPGRGTLMADILRATKNIKGFHDAISVHLIETSPTLKQKQWKLLAGKHPRIEWHDNISTLPAHPLLLVANEFFDALPIRQYSNNEERKITVNDDGMLIFTHPPSDLTETCAPAIAITQQLSSHIHQHGGCALFIDYGYCEGSHGDTLQAMKEHAFHNILETPGEADITAHVDFLALKNASLSHTKHVYGPIAQGAFLMRLGAGQRTTNLCASAAPEQQQNLISGLKRLADPEAMGELFKVLAITSDAIGKPEGF